MTVAIVYGGTSSEAGASAKNAESIAAVLREKGYDVRMVEFRRDMVQTLRAERADIVYLCVQGKHHGDGTLQAMLEHEGIPFTGSGARAAALITTRSCASCCSTGMVSPRPGGRSSAGSSMGGEIMTTAALDTPSWPKRPPRAAASASR